jgi:hypothetical protein
MMTAIQKRWPIIVAVVFAVILVQANVGGNPTSWCCSFTGFPVQWELWGDVLPQHDNSFTWETGINLGLSFFAVALLFGMTLRRKLVVWTQHVLSVLVASIFSWFNPWRQTYVVDTSHPTELTYSVAGFPYVFRFVTRLESLPFLMLNVLIAVAMVVGVFAAFELWIQSHSSSGPAASWNVLRRWAVIVVLSFLFVHANGAVHWTGVPFVYDTQVRTRIWAGVLDVLLGLAFIIVPLLYRPSRRGGSLMAFVTFYVLANFDDWRPLKQFVGTAGGWGFPFTYTTWNALDYNAEFLIRNVVIGLLLTLLIYRITGPRSNGFGDVADFELPGGSSL